MDLTGIHHVTAVTADAPRNLQFYTQVLGMRLVKKTVNQDDTSAYHLFYADGLASPGSDLTFFDFPASPERRGNHTVSRTSLRVAGANTLDWWAARLKDHGVSHRGIAERDGRIELAFEDFEGQRLALVDDGGWGTANPWERSPVPPDRQIRGLGPVEMSVPRLDRTRAVLLDVMGLREERHYTVGGQTRDEEPAEVQVFAMGVGGPGAELHVAVRPEAPAAQPGAGGVHHMAFRTPDRASYEACARRLVERQVRNSGPVDRFYFESLYFREPGGVLFEIATDGPGFATDEPLETLGEKLSLPPFLESRRAAIEANLAPL